MRNWLIDNFYFTINKYRWGRRLIGGTWYKMVTGNCLTPTWTKEKYQSCGPKILNIEYYDNTSN